MFDLTTVWLLMLIIAICASFWQFRKFAELARTSARDYCQRHRLQLLSVPQRDWKLSFSSGLKLTIWYDLNYSADGISSRKGEIELINGRISQISHWS